MRNLLAALALVIPAFAVRAGDHQPPESQPTEVRLLSSGLMGTIGSTIGPDGALYVAEGALGRITREGSRSRGGTIALALHEASTDVPNTRTLQLSNRAPRRPGSRLPPVTPINTYHPSDTSAANRMSAAEPPRPDSTHPDRCRIPSR
jgi:hypothetical protein